MRSAEACAIFIGELVGGLSYCKKQKGTVQFVVLVVLHVLSGTSLETSLGERYIQDNELAALFNNADREIDPKFAQEKPKKRTKKTSKVFYLTIIVFKMRRYGIYIKSQNGALNAQIGSTRKC